jgi:hypothetical protein
MNELAKAVLVLALSTAAAVWLLGLALRLWPSADQLAYGNPLPYLKVKFDRPVNAAKFWVEDFGGLPYERVWLYVNGRLTASGGPGTDAAAKCGDEVAAVVKYYSGTKKLEGRILCTQPIKTPKRAEIWDEYSKVMLYAYQAATGDLDRTGLPINITGYIECEKRNEEWYIYDAWVKFITTEPTAFICLGWTCSQEATFNIGWRCVGILRERGLCFKLSYPYTYDVDTSTYYIYKMPDAALASQYLGGARVAFRITLRQYSQGGDEYLAMYVNGTVVSMCKTTEITVTETYAVYRKPNADGVYLVRIRLSGSNTVLYGSINVYQTSDNKVGFEIYVNPNKRASPSSSGGQCAQGETAVNINGNIVCIQYNKDVVEQGGPFDKFLQAVQRDSNTGNAFLASVRSMTDTSYNVPQTPVGYYTYTYRVKWPITKSHTISLSFKTLMPTSLGVVFANTVLPSGIQMPTIETPNGTNLPPTSFFAVYRGR